jgi:glycosyltransferase involved in cell wall biosynthesis
MPPSVSISPAVSIVMPTFNRLEYLVPAIDSVLAQTFTDWELVVADDGSGPETRSYLAALADPRIRVLLLAHTGKPSVVTNIAIQEAKGEFIAFLDSDDLWLPEKLERQLASLRLYPQRRWSYTRFGIVDGAGNPVHRPGATEWPAPSGSILEKLLDEETVIAQASVLVGHEMLQSIGGLDEELTMCYDDALWFRLAARSEIDGIERVLTLVRRHAQHSGDDVTAWRDRRCVFEKLLCSEIGGQQRPRLRGLRARMAAGLARSQASFGRRTAALSTLASSAPYSWRYAHWWLKAPGTLLRALLPAAMRRRLGAWRRRYSRARPAPPSPTTDLSPS